MSRVAFQIGGRAFAVDVESNPLGWRWWTRGGFDTYGQTRCIPLTYIPNDWGAQLMLCAMEADGSLHVCTPHELFPILDDAAATRGAAAFAQAAIRRHSPQPDLFG